MLLEAEHRRTRADQRILGLGMLKILFWAKTCQKQIVPIFERNHWAYHTSISLITCKSVYLVESPPHPQCIILCGWFYADDDEGSVSGFHQLRHNQFPSLKIPPLLNPNHRPLHTSPNSESSPQLRSMGPMQNLHCKSSAEIFSSLLIIAPQTDAHRRGAFRDFQYHSSNPVPIIAFDHLSLYIQKHLSQSVAVYGKVDHT